MRRLALLIAVGALWLFLAALPALADGGPHVAVDNSGVSTLTADGCAGCHRAHTASAPMLLAEEEPDLCLNCHALGTGAATDVEYGVQYETPNGPSGPALDPDVDPILGALRNGGFVEARIASGDTGVSRLAYYRTSSDISQRPKVGVLATGADVTSVHMDINNPGPGMAWGNGTTGAGVSMTMECTSCHNPHGNGQYRILRDIPTGSGSAAGTAKTVANSWADNDRIMTTADHGFRIGQLVTMAGVTGVSNGTYSVGSTPSMREFTLVGVDITTSGTGGTATVQAEVEVADAPLPAPGDARNYTIMQIKGGQGNNASYLLLASQVQAAAATDSVTFAPVSISRSEADNERVYTGTTNHGLSAGDRVTISGHDATSSPAINGTFTVRDTGYDTTEGAWFFRLYSGATAVNISVDGTAAGTVTKNTITGEFGPTGGDYFHRTVPWNPGVSNTTCNPLVSASATGTGSNPGNAAACSTSVDAPNGQPASITAAGSPINGQVAFNEEITAWCTTCHTRYFASTNPNPTGTAPQYGNAPAAVNLTSSTGGLFTAAANHGLNVGDKVTFSGGTGLPGGTYTVATVPSSTLFSVTAFTGDSTGGAVQRTAPATAQAWWFPRPGDETYKYQHQTTTNRACTTCHVGHGSNAVMDPGGASAEMPFPDGSSYTTVAGSVDSRLLKIDNRGTCQACHDPTETVDAGEYLGPTQSIP